MEEWKSKSIETLKEIKNKRTHCQCSATKVAEKIYFERVIEYMAWASDMSADDLLDYFEKQKNQMPDTSNGRCARTVYSYAIVVVKKYAGKD